MPKLIVTIGVGDPTGTRFHDVQATVETGSTFSAVPASLLHELGVPVERTALARQAHGSTSTVQIGRTMIRLEGQTFPTPVIFVEENRPRVLGMVTLQEALLAVSPDGQQFVPVEADRI